MALPIIHRSNKGNMTMSVLRIAPEFIVDQPATGRSFALAIAIYRRGLRALARIIRIRGDRAWFEDLPDYLLRDIGIDRSEISSVIRSGSKDGRDRLWI
ncbi:hypothetical protein [Mesorhizobium qingshengii]|uniref:DUF1127 domain-containing protein n=1 Tax=Mesorhizobium qingshengii TaxID=1165689 RepID=A0A1G5ZJX1_9HYPH|nr:hypothetical protein [Mesorhizobium qingshengii]SDA94892.1 hypothetical protein SAMN02927914_05272 [Mesorhizobium qingshengii]